MSIGVQNINLFLSAKTPAELVEKQLINNSINGKHYNYQTPMFDGSNYLIWFFEDIEQWQDPESLDDEQKEFLREVYK